MSSAYKVIIGFGCIWGLYAGGAVLWASFTMGANDTAPEILAVFAYGVSILPASLLAIWKPKPAAMWLIALAPLTFGGIMYQVVVKHQFALLPAAEMLIVASLPAVEGILLWRCFPRSATAE